RREYQGETDIVIAEKLKQAFKYQINPILCVGEKLEEREAEKHFEVVKTQIMDALVAQKPEDLSRLIIAYEPVWA
ncbi:MAG TPA: triose-phosphate isomerase, partial [Flavobacteriaceae bacterium]|nr:triose-phosphate isomerase [Flavobacteriaceae bacterium]